MLSRRGTETQGPCSKKSTT